MKSFFELNRATWIKIEEMIAEIARRHSTGTWNIRNSWFWQLATDFFCYLFIAASEGRIYTEIGLCTLYSARDECLATIGAIGQSEIKVWTISNVNTMHELSFGTPVDSNRIE